jgi:hypothetical protein
MEAGRVKVKTIPALEARTQFGQIMKEVRGARFVSWSKSPEWRWSGSSARRSSKRLIAEREARFEVVDRIRRRLPSVPDSEVRRDVREALKRARRRRRA